MEKLICSACGAPLTPNTNEPFLTCEYCDTTVANKYYVAPEVEEAKEPVLETAAETVEPPMDEPVDESEESSLGGGLLKTILGVGTAIAANSARKRARAAVVRRPTASGSVLRTPQRAVHIAPHRHPEPPRTGSFGARPARPMQGGPGRPSGMGRPLGGPGRAGGMNRGGRGGMGGPGGRHR